VVKIFEAFIKIRLKLLKHFSGDIPLGNYGYGCEVNNPITDDIRQYRFLASLLIKELMQGHIRIVGPSGAGKSEFLFKLILNLTLNHNFSLVWFSTKWEDDLQFFNQFFPKYTAISANDISTNRLTKGRFNPLSRIPFNHGIINPQNCRQMADTLIKCIPIKDISGDTEKFYLDAAIRLANIIEILKYNYGDNATLEQILPLWTVLSKSDKKTHPLEILLQSNSIPITAKKRLEKDLLPLLRKQNEADAMVGPTAQQLLNQFQSLAYITSVNEISNFSKKLRHSPRPEVLLIDQSDGLNSTTSQALARLLFPLLYEELVTETTPNWKQENLRPVLMVIDEMGSVFSGELSDFLEKARSKGVYLVFGQQSSSGNLDLRLDAGMSANTRLQVVFSGCKSDDPQIKELNEVAGKFRPPFRSSPSRVRFY
jgi:hypothetical protein